MEKILRGIFLIKQLNNALQGFILKQPGSLNHIKRIKYNYCC